MLHFDRMRCVQRLCVYLQPFQQPRSNEARYQKDILKNSRKGQLIRGFVLRCVSGTVGPVCPLQGVFAWNIF